MLKHFSYPVTYKRTWGTPDPYHYWAYNLAYNLAHLAIIIHIEYVYNEYNQSSKFIMFHLGTCGRK